MDKNVKDFIDTVMNTANAVGETVVEVTKESAKKLGVKKEAAKLSMEVLRIRSAIEGLYNEIGKEAYTIHVSDDEIESEEHQAKIEDLYGEITVKQEQILQLNKRIDLLNGGCVCSSCGRISPPEYDFCPSCGTKLEKPAASSEQCGCGECQQEDTAPADEECGCCCAPEGEKVSEKQDECCGCDGCVEKDSDKN